MAGGKIFLCELRGSDREVAGDRGADREDVEVYQEVRPIVVHVGI